MVSCAAMERLPILDGDTEVSYLAVRYDRPSDVTDKTAAEDTGLAVLYLHGFGSRQSGEKAEFFRARCLQAGLTFCSFDFQGHGESGGDMHGLSLSRNLEDTRRVHDELRRRGHERVVVMGSSMGGWTGLWYLARQGRERREGGALAGLFLAPAVELVDKFLRLLGPDGVEDWQRTGQVRVENDLVQCDLGWGLVQDYQQRYSAEELRSGVRVPCLLLQGQRDDQVDWRAVAAFAEASAPAGTELHLFSDGDHRLIDRKERLWRLMCDFLRSRDLLPQ